MHHKPLNRCQEATLQALVDEARNRIQHGRVTKAPELRPSSWYSYLSTVAGLSLVEMF